MLHLQEATPNQGLWLKPVNLAAKVDLYLSLPPLSQSVCVCNCVCVCARAHALRCMREFCLHDSWHLDKLSCWVVTVPESSEYPGETQWQLIILR